MRTTPSLLAFLALTPLAAAVQAQTADNNLLVQAGRMAQRQFDAPASVAVVDAQAIRNAGAQVNLSEALAQVPGVVALNRNNYAQDVQISIRGFGARAAFGLRGIRLITDGIPATIPDGQGQASTVSLTSAERIEVLTGPLAQLYGNSAGGVIQTFTREAGAKPELDASTTFGSNGLRRHDVQFSGRTGSVGLVADYSVFSTDGYRANSAAERKQFNGVLSTQLQDDTRLKIIASSFDMPLAQDPLGLTAKQLSDDPRQAGTGAVSTRTRKVVAQSQLGAVLDHRFSSDLDMQWRAYSGTRHNLQYQSTSKWVGLDRDFYGLGGQLKGKLRGLSSGQVDWVVGLDIDRSSEVRQGGATTSGEKSGPVTRNELNAASNTDSFAQVNWRLDPALAPLTVTAGVRRSEVELRSRDDMAVTPSDPDGSGSVKYQATNPVVGLTWHALDTLNVFANWGKGFETPTLAEAAYVKEGALIKGKFNTSLMASRSQHKEVGFKWTPAPATRLQAALFHVATDNELVTLLSIGGNTAFKNAPSTTRQGAELSATHLLNPQWRGLASASWLQATYDTAFNSVPAGNRLPGIPSQQLFASLQWAEQGFASKDRFGPMGWSGAIDWVARSALWASDMNDAPSRAPGYGMLNLKLRHRTDLGRAKIETWAGLDNATNQTTVGSVIVNQASAQYFEPGLPRNWMAGLKVSVPL